MKLTLRIPVLLVFCFLAFSSFASGHSNPDKEKEGSYTVTNPSIFPRTIHVRVDLPDDAPTRNTGYVYTIPPFGSDTRSYPIGTKVYCCSGKYWDNYQPRERLVTTIQSEEAGKYSVKDFKRYK